MFSLYSLAVEEAKNSAGVLMGHEPLVKAPLKAGELVAPFESRVRLDRRMTICVAGSVADNPIVNAIIDALLEE